MCVVNYILYVSASDGAYSDRKAKAFKCTDVPSFKEADCDTDHYLVVAKIRERLAVNKQGSHKFHMERGSISRSWTR
jgi:hypothetical protein